MKDKRPLCEYHNCLMNETTKIGEFTPTYTCDLCEGDKEAIIAAEKRGAEMMLAAIASKILTLDTSPEALGLWAEYERLRKGGE